MFPEVITTALKNTLLYTACGFVRDEEQPVQMTLRL